MKTYSLDINAEEHFDFDIFSITCTESIYRVVHELNQALNIDLQLNDLLDFTHKEGEDFYYTLEGYKCFTSKYHLKRGYCCKNNCRHCPYGFDPKNP